MGLYTLFANQVLLVFFIAFMNSIRMIFSYHSGAGSTLDNWGTGFHEASCMKRAALDVTTSPWWWLKLQRMTVGAVEWVAACGRRKKKRKGEKLKMEPERLKRGSGEKLETA